MNLSCGNCKAIRSFSGQPLIRFLLPRGILQAMNEAPLRSCTKSGPLGQLPRRKGLPYHRPQEMESAGRAEKLQPGTDQIGGRMGGWHSSLPCVPNSNGIDNQKQLELKAIFGTGLLASSRLFDSGYQHQGTACEQICGKAARTTPPFAGSPATSPELLC